MSSVDIIGNKEIILTAARRLGQMSDEDYFRARDVKATTGETIPAGRKLTSYELAALMDGFARDLAPRRYT
jgi:hypothetical protein